MFVTLPSANWLIVLKPTAVEYQRCPYAITRGPLLPDPDTVKEALMQWLPLDSARAGILVRTAEEYAKYGNLSILGAIFIVGIEAIGIQVDPLARISVKDPLRLVRIYPEFESLRFRDDVIAKAIFRNNTGSFALYTGQGRDISASELPTVLNELKKSFREAVNSKVRRLDHRLRDHVIHIPNDINELAVHLQIFAMQERVEMEADRATEVGRICNPD